MSIDLLIALAAGFAAGGILLWVIARLAAQKISAVCGLGVFSDVR